MPVEPSTVSGPYNATYRVWPNQAAGEPNLSEITRAQEHSNANVDLHIGQLAPLLNMLDRGRGALVADFLRENPDLPPQEVKKVLQESTRRLQPPREAYRFLNQVIQDGMYELPDSVVEHIAERSQQHQALINAARRTNDEQHFQQLQKQAKQLGTDRPAFIFLLVQMASQDYDVPLYEDTLQFWNQFFDDRLQGAVLGPTPGDPPAPPESPSQGGGGDDPPAPSARSRQKIQQRQTAPQGQRVYLCHSCLTAHAAEQCGGCGQSLSGPPLELDEAQTELQELRKRRQVGLSYLYKELDRKPPQQTPSREEAPASHRSSRPTSAEQKKRSGKTR